MRRVALDIGGANLKAARLNDGALQARSVPFALWRRPDQLAEQLTQLLRPWDHFDELVVTMTGELCDCYETRRQGVNQILDAAVAAAGEAAITVYLTDGCFVAVAEARARPLAAAASNWHALGSYVAGRFPLGLTLLIDIGSSTTDIIPLHDAKVCARGKTDSERLASGELVYVGGQRTALMALGPTVSFCGRDYRIMSEFFATTADVSVLLGRMAEDGQCLDTADGRPLTRRHCAARVLRMIGGDLESFTPAQATALAEAFDDVLRQRLVAAVKQVIGSGAAPDRVVISGSGAFLADAVLEEAFDGADVPRVHLRDCLGEQASAAACAAAMLYL